MEICVYNSWILFVWCFCFNGSFDIFVKAALRQPWVQNIFQGAKTKNIYHCELGCSIINLIVLNHSIVSYYIVFYLIIVSY